MARRKAKKKQVKSNGAGRLLIRLLKYGLFQKAASVLIIALTLFLLRGPIAEALMKAFGFGIIPITVWLIIIATILIKRRFDTVKTYWNDWLGALIFSAALLGIMALFKPDAEIADVSLQEESLAGATGMAIRGTSFEWARLSGLILVGAICIIPNHILTFTRNSIGSIWQLIHNAIILLAFWVWQILRKMRTKTADLARYLKNKFTSSRKHDKAPAEAVMAASTPVKVPQINSPIPEIIPEYFPSEVEQMMEGPKEAASKTDAVVAYQIGDELPSIEILDEAPKTVFAQANDNERARLIKDALASYGVEVKVEQINPGPSVTQFGIEPGWVRKYKRVIERDPNGKPRLDKDGNTKYRMEEISKTRVKVEKITSLSNDLALALAVSDIRIEAPMPGKALVGIEVPNVSTAIVSLRNVIESAPFQKLAAKSKLAMALGQGAGGEAVAGDLAKMPHLLIAGATGSGKSVCLNCIVSCLLAQTSPNEVRMLLIDPKRVEMATFADVPHLITPVVVDADKAVDALRRVTAEMDIRYRKFASVGVRNIDGYNRSPKVSEKLPYIVVIVDELADLMMTAPDAAEPLICRLAQLSRATGIHLIIATQRPSVDVITGLIKANFPTRISFAVVSAIDSRTILDAVGAEKLLGRGDMLYVPPEASKPKRIRGCYVSDDEMERLVGFWKNWAVNHFPPERDRVAQDFNTLSVQQQDDDPMLAKARQICAESVNVSASFLQRKLHIGYQRASRLMDQLEEEGLLDDSDEFKEPWGGE